MLLAVRARLCLGTGTQRLPLWRRRTFGQQHRIQQLLGLKHSSRIPDLSPHQTPAKDSGDSGTKDSGKLPAIRRSSVVSMQFSRSQAAPLAVPRSPLGASRRDVSQRDVLDRYWIGIGSAVVCVTLPVQPVLNAAFLMTVTPSSIQRRLRSTVGNYGRHPSRTAVMSHRNRSDAALQRS